MIPTVRSQGVPSLDEQRAYFDAWNAEYRARSFEEIDVESKARGQRVLDVLSGLGGGGKILQVGCGTGWLTERLSALGMCTALDLSERAIEIAKSKGIPALFVVGDFHSWAPPDRYDIAVCVETISYVSDQRLFVQRLFEALKPGGYLIVTAVNRFVYERRSDVGPPGPGQIRKWLSRRELLRLIGEWFKVVETTTVLPAGDRGILRLTQSHKVNWLLKQILSESTIVGLKEWLGLGHCRVVLAQKPA